MAGMWRRYVFEVRPTDKRPQGSSILDQRRESVVFRMQCCAAGAIVQTWTGFDSSNLRLVKSKNLLSRVGLLTLESPGHRFKMNFRIQLDWERCFFRKQTDL